MTGRGAPKRGVRGGASGSEPLPRSVTTEPDELLAHAMEGVRPLPDRARVPTRAPAPPRGTSTPPAPEFEVESDGEAIAGRVRDLPRRAMRRLDGERPAATLDLHGLGTEEARRKLEAFVRRSAESGHRTLLVVHGKGTHSEGAAVLKGEITRWLTTGPTAARVLAFTTAPKERGGTGALLVLLRATDR